MDTKPIRGAVPPTTQKTGQAPSSEAFASREWAAICRRDQDREAYAARSRARRAQRDALSGKRGYGRER